VQRRVLGRRQVQQRFNAIRLILVPAALSIAPYLLPKPAAAIRIYISPENLKKVTGVTYFYKTAWNTCFCAMLFQMRLEGS